MKQKPTNHVLAFLSLEDFAEEVIPLDNLVRVEGVNWPLPTKGGPGRLLQWLAIVTAQLADNQTAACSILTGEAWELFARDETYHHDNAEQAVTLVRQYLEAQGFVVGKGILNPGAVMDNIVRASANLWHFEDKKLVPNQEEPETCPHNENPVFCNECRGIYDEGRNP